MSKEKDIQDILEDAKDGVLKDKTIKKVKELSKKPTKKAQRSIDQHGAIWDCSDDGCIVKVDGKRYKLECCKDFNLDGKVYSNPCKK